ncbi:hypothetical protein KKA33_03525 [Patescibacteria group bacterium]|nr:hypothetical protein [Patescibacteria group bacterium]
MKYFLVVCMFILAIHGCAISSSHVQEDPHQPKQWQFVWTSNHVIVQFADNSVSKTGPLVALLPKSPKEASASDMENAFFLTGKEVKKGIWVFELYTQVSSELETLIVNMISHTVTASFTNAEGKTEYSPGFPYDFCEPVRASGVSKKIAGELFEISNTKYPDYFVECIDYECSDLLAR